MLSKQGHGFDPERSHMFCSVAIKERVCYEGKGLQVAMLQEMLRPQVEVEQSGSECL